MSKLVRSVIIAVALVSTVSAASAAPSTWNPDKFFEELQKVGA